MTENIVLRGQPTEIAVQFVRGQDEVVSDMQDVSLTVILLDNNPIPTIVYGPVTPTRTGAGVYKHVWTPAASLQEGLYSIDWYGVDAVTGQIMAPSSTIQLVVDQDSVADAGWTDVDKVLDVTGVQVEQRHISRANDFVEAVLGLSTDDHERLVWPKGTDAAPSMYGAKIAKPVQRVVEWQAAGYALTEQDLQYTDLDVAKMNHVRLDELAADDELKVFPDARPWLSRARILMNADRSLRGKLPSIKNGPRLQAVSQEEGLAAVTTPRKGRLLPGVDGQLFGSTVQ